MRMCLALRPTRSWNDIRALAEAAITAGWDALRCPDAPGPAAECWTLAGALSQLLAGPPAALEPSRVGTGAAGRATPALEIQVVVDQARARHPAVVAKEYTTADRLCGGRLLLGLQPRAGAGGEAEFADAVAVIRRLIDGGPATLNAGRYRLVDAPFDPVPLRQPFAVLTVGGSAALAARVGDHWGVTAGPDEKAGLATALTAAGGGRVALSVAPPPGLRLDEAAVASYARAEVPELVIEDDRLGNDGALWPGQLTALRAAAHQGG